MDHCILGGRGKTVENGWLDKERAKLANPKSYTARCHSNSSAARKAECTLQKMDNSGFTMERKDTQRRGKLKENKKNRPEQCRYN